MRIGSEIDLVSKGLVTTTTSIDGYYSIQLKAIFSKMLISVVHKVNMKK